MSPARALAENAYASRLQPFFNDEKNWPPHQILKIHFSQPSFGNILQERSISKDKNILPINLFCPIFSNHRLYLRVIPDFSH
jgi:hypothetical protein